MKTYLVIRKYEGDNSIVKKFDVTEKSETNTIRLEDGININLDHNNFYTEIIDED